MRSGGQPDVVDGGAQGLGHHLECLLVDVHRSDGVEVEVEVEVDVVGVAAGQVQLSPRGGWVAPR